MAVGRAYPINVSVWGERINNYYFDSLLEIWFGFSSLAMGRTERKRIVSTTGSTI